MSELQESIKAAIASAEVAAWGEGYMAAKYSSASLADNPYRGEWSA